MVIAAITFGENSIDDRLGIVIVIEASSASESSSSATNTGSISSAITPPVQASSSSSSRIISGCLITGVISSSSLSSTNSSSSSASDSISVSTMSASMTSASSTSTGSSSTGSSNGSPPPPDSIRERRRSIASSLSCSELDVMTFVSGDFSEIFWPSKRDINSSFFPEISSPFSLHKVRSSETFIDDSESRSRPIPPVRLTLGSRTLGLSTPSAFRSAERAYVRVRVVARRRNFL